MIQLSESEYRKLKPVSEAMDKLLLAADRMAKALSNPMPATTTRLLSSHPEAGRRLNDLNALATEWWVARREFMERAEGR